MMKVEKIFAVTLAGLLLFTTGCAEWCKREPAVQEPHPAPVAINPCAAPAMTQMTQSYPLSPAESFVRLEKMSPTEVRANEPFDYRIKVTNLTDSDLTNVIVTDQISGNMKVQSAEPQFRRSPEETEAGYVRWYFENLAANTSEMITVTAVAHGTGRIGSCAEVTYDTLCAMANIVEPALRLTKIAPAESLVCDRIPFEYVVTNTGTGYACDIVIEEALHQQLMTSQGGNNIMFTLDALGPGESKEFSTTLDATATGTYSSKAVAKSRSAGTAESNMTTTVVKQPMLAINEVGPSKQYIGRTLTYEITVTNRGDGIARDTVVEAMVPENISFENATLGGTFSRSSPGRVLWNIGTLEPNASKKLSMTLTGYQQGSMQTTTSAKAYCADAVSTSVETMISGIPGILLEVIDVSDPIELGKDETYIITVTNQGSATDSNIKISCTLEDAMEYISSTGPTTAAVEGNTITFAPLASLAPKTQAQWRVNIRAAGEGDIRFKTVMTSEHLTRTVEETEATRFYE